MGKPYTYSAAELQKLGAPFPTAEIQISAKKQIARLVLVLLNPTKDFPFVGTVKETVDLILQDARTNGMLDENSHVVIVDLDSLPTN